ncbi:MAG: hypothetical protein GPOALKHO_000695 [Sodalis sp.]|nr:MAG: hypothetical protein GPOALKHO_000695 [Sodalis sp.]
MEILSPRRPHRWTNGLHHIENDLGDEERADFARYAVHQGAMILFNQPEAADTQTDGRSDTIGAFFGHHQAGVPHIWRPAATPYWVKASTL